MTTAMRLGVDLGGTKIEIAALDDAGDVRLRERIATPASSYAAIVDAVAGLVERTEAKLGTRAPVGIGTPGARSRATGLMRNSNTVVLNGRPLLEDLQRRLARPLRIANDANCFALAEATRGAGAGARVVFGVILGTGVGGGLVVDGAVLDGPNGIAGEWGHNPLVADDDAGAPACYCGRRGCVETFISGPAVERRYVTLGGAAARMDAIVDRARAGEAIARQVVDEFLDRFGRALANLITILDPDCVVLGGGVSKTDELYTAGRAAVARYVFNDELRTPIVRPQLGDSAGVIGAAWLTGAV